MSYILDALKRSEQDRHQEKVSSINNDMMVMPRNMSRQPLWPYLLIFVLLLNAGALIFYFLGSNSTDESGSSENSLLTDNKALSSTEPDIKDTGRKTKALPSHLIDKAPIQAKPLHILKDNFSDKRSAKEDKEPVGADDVIRPKAGVKRISPPLAEPYSEAAPVSKAVEEKILPTSVNDESDRSEQISSAPNAFSDLPLLSEMNISFQRGVPTIEFSSHIYSSEPSARRAMINNLYLREGDGFSGLVIREIGEFYLALDKQGTIFKIPVLRDWQAP